MPSLEEIRQELALKGDIELALPRACGERRRLPDEHYRQVARV